MGHQTWGEMQHLAQSLLYKMFDRSESRLGTLLCLLGLQPLMLQVPDEMYEVEHRSLRKLLHGFVHTENFCHYPFISIIPSVVLEVSPSPAGTSSTLTRGQTKSRA